MNIVDAMKSGKTVKRKPWNRFGHIEYFDRFTFTNNHTTLLEKEDVIADDWEIEEQKVEVTKNQIRDLLNKYWNNVDVQVGRELILKDLGFED